MLSLVRTPIVSWSLCLVLLTRSIYLSNKFDGKIELLVFNLVESEEGEEVSHDDHVIYNVKPGNLFQKVLDVVITNHNLTITTITSIPMKV